MGSHIFLLFLNACFMYSKNIEQRSRRRAYTTEDTTMATILQYVHLFFAYLIAIYHDAFGVYALVLSSSDPTNAIMHGSRHN